MSAGNADHRRATAAPAPRRHPRHPRFGEAVDRCYTAGGGAAIYDDSALQRVFRDVHVATQHAMVAPRTHELTGRLRLGLPTDTGQL